uniref:Uncharacterized protein n=1 Tax=Timema cristinae TaxID=61476 RepID=A0A7R9D8R3_TIMCR|nr:unnamed protein product [Timema cristinae]
MKKCRVETMKMDSKEFLQTIKAEPTFDYSLELHQEMNLKTEELLLKIEVDVEPSLNLEDQIKLNEENDILTLRLSPPIKKELMEDSSNSTLYESWKPSEEYLSWGYIQETNENKPITLSQPNSIREAEYINTFKTCQNNTNKEISPECHTNINPNASQYKCDLCVHSSPVLYQRGEGGFEPPPAIVWGSAKIYTDPKIK